MAIIGLEGNITVEQLDFELQRGAKFVVFYYCISVILMTFKRGSSVYFIKPGESTVGKSLPFTLLSAVLGWWGIPWGPIYTVQSIYKNCSGGEDVTAKIRGALTKPAVARTAVAAAAK
jgi:hypothetical protein